MSFMVTLDGREEERCETRWRTVAFRQLTSPCMTWVWTVKCLGGMNEALHFFFTFHLSLKSWKLQIVFEQCSAARS